MVLLVLRHTLPVIIYGAGDYTITLFMVSSRHFHFEERTIDDAFSTNIFAYDVIYASFLQLLMLRTIGILLPVYIMVKAFTAIQRRRHIQVSTIQLAKYLGKLGHNKLVNISLWYFLFRKFYCFLETVFS